MKNQKFFSFEPILKSDGENIAPKTIKLSCNTYAD